MKLLSALLLLFFFNAGAQNANPCEAPEVKQFDFWVGDWIATWGDTLHGTNHIRKNHGRLHRAGKF